MSEIMKVEQQPELEIVNVRRRQVRAKESRDKLVEAATVEFAAHGFSGASTRVIADLAGVRHSLLIYHFKNKRGLWEAVMTNVISIFTAVFTQRLAELVDADDVTKLRALCADFIRLAARHPELHRLMSHEAWERNDRIEWIIRTLIGEGRIPLPELIASAQAQGHFIKGDPLHLYYAFLGAAGRIFMLSGEIEMVTQMSPFSQKFVEEHIRICEEMFFR